MDKFLSVYKKEMRSFFSSPIAYGAILFFLLFSGVVFLWVGQFLAGNTASLRGYFGLFPFIFIVLLPALTMRSWADERRLGSQELLLTLPVKVSQLVVAKFAATYTVVVLMIALTVPLVAMTTALGQFEIGEILGEYLGTLLLAAAGTAIGIFVSSLTVNSISAFLLGLAALLVMTGANLAVQFLGLPDFLQMIVRFFSLEYRYTSFEKGVIDTRDLFYFVWLVALSLWANTKILLLRKWR